MPPALPSLTDPRLPNAGRGECADDWLALWQQMLQARFGRPIAVADANAMPLLRATGAHGWQLVAPCHADSAALFSLYKPLLDARLATAASPAAPPWVLAQLGQSLDGCVATAAGDSYFVTGAHSLLHLHRLRALCDVVLVGAGTVATDDPQLTTRRVPGPQPVRAVLDPAARLDGRARMFRDAQAPTLWICDARHAATARSRLGGVAPMASSTPHSTEVLAVDGLLDSDDSTHGHAPQRALAALAARGLRLVFVEGGGITVSRFLAAGVLDRLHLVVAPVLIGNGRRGLQGPVRQAMADCPRPLARTLALGEDMLWDLDLRAASAPPA